MVCLLKGWMACMWNAWPGKPGGMAGAVKRWVLGWRGEARVARVRGLPRGVAFITEG